MIFVAATQHNRSSFFKLNGIFLLIIVVIITGNGAILHLLLMPPLAVIMPA